jgi:hypothetical protein
LSRLEKDCGEPRGGPGGDEALVEVPAEIHALSCGGERDLHVADRKGHDGAVEEVPRQRLRVA